MKGVYAQDSGSRPQPLHRAQARGNGKISTRVSSFNIKKKTLILIFIVVFQYVNVFDVSMWFYLHFGQFLFFVSLQACFSIGLTLKFLQETVNTGLNISFLVFCTVFFSIVFHMKLLHWNPAWETLCLSKILIPVQDRGFLMLPHCCDSAGTRAARRRRCSSGRRRPAPPLRPARRPSAAPRRTTRRRTATTTAPCRSAPRPSNCCWWSLARARGLRRYGITADPTCLVWPIS